MAAPKSLRYTVDGSDKSYADPGPALSLTITLASNAARLGQERTYYVRDAVTGEPKGYSESSLVNGALVVTTVRPR